MSERNPVQLTLPGRDGAPPVTRTVYTSYIYCGICGHRPGANDDPNYGPSAGGTPTTAGKSAHSAVTAPQTPSTTNPKRATMPGAATAQSPSPWTTRTKTSSLPSTTRRAS